MRKPHIAEPQVYNFIDSLTEGELHAKRVASLAGATLGVIEATSLAVSAIGRGLALARGIRSKHAVKQVDRLLSNRAIDVWDLFEHWVPYIIAERTEIVVAVDWTDFDKDDQTTLAIKLITSHGRATPLLWMTVRKSELADQRNAHEDRLLMRLRELIPEHVRVTVLADRGFGDSKLYALLTELRFNYVVRFRECILVTDTTGETRPASEWVPRNGRTRVLVDARVTAERVPVAAVVCVKAKGMKDSWCMVVGEAPASGAQVVKLYGKRFTIEESFRDAKDLRFGMGLSATRVSSPERRDRLLLLSALAVVLLTLLGVAGEEIGMDRMLKANTEKRRTHSLMFQGSHYYAAIPTMPEKELVALMRAFHGQLARHQVLRDVFGVI